MADPAQSDSGNAPPIANGPRVIDPAQLKQMRENVEAKYAGTQEALEKNKEREEGQKKGLRAQQMEGIVKHHND